MKQDFETIVKSFSDSIEEIKNKALEKLEKSNDSDKDTENTDFSKRMEILEKISKRMDILEKSISDITTTISEFIKNSENSSTNEGESNETIPEIDNLKKDIETLNEELKKAMEKIEALDIYSDDEDDDEEEEDNNIQKSVSDNLSELIRKAAGEGMEVVVREKRNGVNESDEREFEIKKSADGEEENESESLSKTFTSVIFGK
jgi:Rad3-related DNA helicase